MKKYLFILIFLSTIILSWCGQKEHINFDFEDFNWKFFTENTFTENTKVNWESLWSTLLKDSILKIYTQSESTWYNDSIIIIKKSNIKNLDTFVSQNKEKIKLDWYKEGKQKEFKIKCGDIRLLWNTLNLELEQNLNTIFFSQNFFVKNNTWYIVSFASDDKKERDNFSSNISQLNCK